MSTRPRPAQPHDLRAGRERDRLNVDALLREAPAPEKSGRLRKLGEIFIAALVIGLGWTAWAGYAVYDLASAVHELDPVALERRVDWTAVQQGLREDLARAPTSGDGVTRQSIARALREAKFNGADTQNGNFWSRIESARYSGGPFAFRLDLKPDDGGPDDIITLLFKWSGDWRLTRIFAPGGANAPALFAERVGIFQGAHVPPQHTAALAAPPRRAEPPAMTGPKVILFEEDFGDPQGRRYEGSVSWQTELTPANGDSLREPVVRADVSMPERPLAMTLWIRRNADRSLPASHTIEVKFDLPADSTTGGIRDVPAIMLKDTAEGRGTRLAGISVSAAENFFLIGLSAIEHDVENNVRLLKERSWFDIPVAYGSRNRAVLAIEKGPIGEKVVTDALVHWGRVAVSGRNEQQNPQ